MALEKVEFHKTAENFLAAVANRDFETFQSFLRADLGFQAVLPGGVILDSVASFIENQKTWFSGTTGNFKYVIDRTEISVDLGTVHSKVHYSNVDAKGSPFELEIYITFVFRKIDGDWFLIHDQNTVMRERREE